MNIETEDLNSTLISIILGCVLFIFENIYSGLMLLVSFISNDAREFMAESKELVQWCVAVLILIKVSWELAKSFKKK